MFPEFSPTPTMWAIFAVVVFILLFFIFRYISKRLEEIFRPYKKGKRYWCKIIAVSDGDTVTCKRLNLRRSQTRIRLAYIDAPESSQAYGRETQQMVVKLVQMKIVRIHIVDTDRYGRHVGEIHRRGRSINEELIKRGGAWVYEDYIKDKQKLAYLNKLQQEAKSKKKGLWQQSRPVKPSVYRRNN